MPLAGMVKGYHRCFPSIWHGFESRCPLQTLRGGSSVVERFLAKEEVASSNLVSRSKTHVDAWVFLF